MVKHLLKPENARVVNGRKIILLTGKLTKRKRAEVIDDMNSDPTCLVFLTFQTGSTGHNFQTFHNVLFLDRCWNPQVNLINQQSCTYLSLTN